MNNKIKRLIRNSDIEDVRLLWLSRLLVPLEGYKIFLGKSSFNDDSIARAVGLNDYLYDADPQLEYDINVTLKRLREHFNTLELHASELEVPNQTLRVAISTLAKSLGLTSVEEEILHFCVIVKQDEMLTTAVDMLGGQSSMGVARILRVCLGLDGEEVNKALRPGSTLINSGLFGIDTSAKYQFTSKVDLLERLLDGLELGATDVVKMFGDIFIKAPRGKLSMDDYAHLSNEVTPVSEYLKNSLCNHRCGVNILLHGNPGTGKTECVRMLAENLDFELFEVAIEDRNSKPHDGNQRFRSYKLGQMLCASRTNTAILFDEAEDVFCERQEKHPSVGKNKAWVNRLLEENPAPAFWITNDVSQIDPAFVRRFDFVIAMNAPPRSVRERILNRYLDGMEVSTSWKKRIAEFEHLPPAIVERVANVARSTNASTPHGTEKLLETLLSNTLEAMGHGRLSLRKNSAEPMYRLDVINADGDLQAVCNGLKQYRQGRLCLYGAPGTGKTAFGRHVAELLDMPLLAKRASDIMSPWLGEMEQNMARMFSQAHADGAVLLLDEADSFLLDRHGDKRSWEISSVNEMLTQMENFDGIFIASTNFLESMDGAAMRRFDIKLKFDYLRPEQSWNIFTDTAEALGLEVDPSLKPIVGRLNMLTPGDFATVMRKSRLTRVSDAKALVELLKFECVAKPEGRVRTIGF